MKIDVTATVKEIGQIESFGKNGFQKRNVILTEQSGEYENLYCFEFSGDKIGLPEGYQIGQTVKCGGFVNCREHEGRYYTSLRGSFIQSAGDQQQAPVQQFGQPPVQQQVQPQPSTYESPTTGYQVATTAPQQPATGYQQPQDPGQTIQQPVQQTMNVGQPQANNRQDIPF